MTDINTPEALIASIRQEATRLLDRYSYTEIERAALLILAQGEYIPGSGREGRPARRYALPATISEAQDVLATSKIDWEYSRNGGTPQAVRAALDLTEIANRVLCKPLESSVLYFGADHQFRSARVLFEYYREKRA